MTVEGELVSFVDIERLPVGAKVVGRVKENMHTFYRLGPQLLMQDCVGNFYEIDGDFKHLSFREISNDFEMAPDEWGERIHCEPRRRPVRVHVRQYRRRR